MDDLIYFKDGHYYQVYYNNEDLETIKNEAIENASQIIHRNYKGNYRYSPFYRSKTRDQREIRNFTNELVDTVRDYNGRKEKIYHYEYDQYLFPYIVTLINRLEYGDVKVLDEIYNPDYVKEFVPEYYKINELEKKLVRMDNNKINEKLEILYELKYLLKKLRDTKIDIPVEKYYKELQNVILLEKVNSLEYIK